MSTDSRAAEIRATGRPAARSRLRTRAWGIVAALSVTETVSWGILYYAFAVFLVPMQRGLGFSAAELTGAFSLAMIVSGIAGIAVGRYLDRHSPRALMTLASVARACTTSQVVAGKRSSRKPPPLSPQWSSLSRRRSTRARSTTPAEADNGLGDSFRVTLARERMVGIERGELLQLWDAHGHLAGANHRCARRDA